MSAYPNKMHEVTLHGGKKVVLPEWQDLKPPVHGEGLGDSAYNPKTGERPQFYASTAEWMRNEGALKSLPGANVSLGGQHLRLFHFPTTRTWHASDALDIDHIKPWREHLQAKGVDNRADAARAYNDVDNLRVIPSVYNRARDSADKIIKAHGVDSKQWQQWTQQRLGFDPKVEVPAFDPERDLARRTRATIGQVWTDKHTRSDLGFDTRVLDKWFNHALKAAYAGTVTVENPVTKKPDAVPLFRCGASKQLTTRDALDIDHEIPFELVCDKMRELFPKHVLTKADMLDVYNDTSNLRLVTRGANSSHEYELGVDGQWRDPVAPQKPGEFSGFIVAGPSPDDKALQLIKAHFSREGAVPPKQADDRVVNMLIPRRPHEPDNLKPLAPQALAAADTALTRPESPYHGIYGKVSDAVECLSDSDPHFFASMKQCLGGKPPAPGHIENIATTLIAAAKHGQLTRIDAIVTNQDRTRLFVIQGQGEAARRVDVPLATAMQRSVEENSRQVSLIDRQAVQQPAAPAQPQLVASMPMGSMPMGSMQAQSMPAQGTPSQGMQSQGMPSQGAAPALPMDTGQGTATDAVKDTGKSGQRL